MYFHYYLPMELIVALHLEKMNFFYQKEVSFEFGSVVFEKILFVDLRPI